MKDETCALVLAFLAIVGTSCQLIGDHPKDNELMKLYLRCRPELGEIRGMLREDRTISAVTMTFADREVITEGRVDRYRSLFKSCGLQGTVVASREPLQVRYLVSGKGLAFAGASVKGIVYSEAVVHPLVESLDDFIGQHDSIYRYRSIEDGWYIYFRSHP